nr:MAG TPA: hypothetical protein [Bacteriophage sp.]
MKSQPIFSATDLIASVLPLIPCIIKLEFWLSYIYS